MNYLLLHLLSNPSLEILLKSGSIHIPINKPLCFFDKILEIERDFRFNKFKDKS